MMRTDNGIIKPVIGVYTSDSVLYFELITVLRKRGIPFISLSSIKEIPDYVTVIITTENESKLINEKIKIYGYDPETLINIALVKLCKVENLDTIVLGIDPGPYPAMSTIVDGNLVDVEQFYTLRELNKKIRGYRHVASKIILKIGNGDPLNRDKIIEHLSKSVDRVIIINEKYSSRQGLAFSDLPFKTLEEKRVKSNKGASIIIGYSSNEDILDNNNKDKRRKHHF
ncbi:MAG: hypothetical protein M1411_03720 [Candidatus Thermoplasmatota archaeon]|jgi:hypothetical protein|nr:hypothetical protein [Candidatus Thermoplasmatota archaeon]